MTAKTRVNKTNNIKLDKGLEFRMKKISLVTYDS